MPGPSVVLLAGGASVRFGSDKLAARVGDSDLLSLTLSRLPPGPAVTVVGPRRPLAAAQAADGTAGPPRTVTWVRESPAGSGPARALHVGVVAALAAGPSLPVVVLPADAPDAHLAVEPLLAALSTLLERDPAALGVVGVDGSGGPQPLHLALAPAAGAALEADPPAPGSSARALVRALRLEQVPLPARSTQDVDTLDDLAAWQREDGSAAGADHDAAD